MRAWKNDGRSMDKFNPQTSGANNQSPSILASLVIPVERPQKQPDARQKKGRCHDSQAGAVSLAEQIDYQNVQQYAPPDDASFQSVLPIGFTRNGKETVVDAALEKIGGWIFSWEQFCQATA